MSLFDTKADCKMYAKKLDKRYEEYDITFLADEYCKAKDAHDTEKQNVYISALLLRFWYVIDRMYNKLYSLGYTRDDVFNKVYECIEVACTYRAWQDPAKKTNAQACIHQVLSSRGVPAMAYEATHQHSNIATASLDDKISENSENTVGEIVEDTRAQVEDTAKFIIQALLSNNKIIEAIIADIIAYNDTFKHEHKTVKSIENEVEKKYVVHTYEFWPFRLTQELNSIDADYSKYFLSNYNVNKEKFSEAVKCLAKASNQKKYKMISKSLETMKAYV